MNLWRVTVSLNSVQKVLYFLTKGTDLQAIKRKLANKYTLVTAEWIGEAEQTED